MQPSSQNLGMSQAFLMSIKEIINHQMDVIFMVSIKLSIVHNVERLVVFFPGHFLVFGSFWSFLVMGLCESIQSLR